MQEQYEFDAEIYETKDNGGAYVIFPWNVREEFGAGRARVRVLFDGIPYEGSVVNMGVKDEEGRVRYVIGMLKSIRKALGKSGGDRVHVTVTRLEGRTP